MQSTKKSVKQSICWMGEQSMDGCVGSDLRPTYSLLGTWPNSLHIWPNHLCIAYAVHAHA